MVTYSNRKSLPIIVIGVTEIANLSSIENILMDPRKEISIYFSLSHKVLYRILFFFIQFYQENSEENSTLWSGPLNINTMTLEDKNLNVSMTTLEGHVVSMETIISREQDIPTINILVHFPYKVKELSMKFLF